VALPTITVPDFPILTDFLGGLLKQIPFEIPVMLHPPLVHFAIALPVIIVILELFNIFAKASSTAEAPRGSTVSALSFFMIVLLVVVSIGAYATGSADGKNTWDLLDAAGQADLKAHKLLGAYIVLASIVLLVFKIISFAGTKTRLLFFILALGFTFISLQQGKSGGAIVYTHGANVEKVKTLDEKLFDAEDALDTIKSEKATLDKNATDLKDATTALQERMTTLTQEKIALQVEKNSLDEEVKTLKAQATDAVSAAKAEAASAIEAAKKEAMEQAKVAIEAAKAEAASAKADATATIETAEKEIMEKAKVTIEAAKAEAKKLIEAAKAENATPEATN